MTATESDHFGGMPANAASGQLHEVVPIVGFLPAAAPVLLQVVEDRSPFVIVAGLLSVFVLVVVLPAALIDAPQLPLLRQEGLLVLLGFCGRFLLLLLLEVYLAHSLPLLYWLMS